MENDQNEQLNNKTKVCCCSRSNVEQANRRVHLKTVFADDDLVGEELRKRFEEVYNSAIHENISFDHKTWSEVAEEDNSTVDFDPVDSSLKEKMDEKILQLDDLIVETSKKRKTIPPQTSRQLAKFMKVQRKSSALCMQLSENKPAVIQRLPLDEEELARCKGRLEAVSKGFHSSSKLLPTTEDKVLRLKDALVLSSSMASSHTYKVLQNPLPDEAVLATSLTHLKKILETTPESRPIGNPGAAEKIRCGHPITRYHKRSMTQKEEEIK